MGNIIKFDLSHFPDALQPEGLEYWEQVKEEYMEKYGADEHHATLMVADELALSPRVKKLIDGIGFSQIEETLTAGTLEAKICEYADMRVAPGGIVSIKERLKDGRRRYEGRTEFGFSVSRYDELVESLKALERELFSDSTIRPEHITDELITLTLDPLRKIAL